MNGQPVKKVVIAGGGTAGWCAAAALSRYVGSMVEIVLVESEEIGIVGVGEATIPTVRTFHQYLGIDERDFLRAANATYKLGIAFEDWARIGDRYVHSFGEIGESTWFAPFHHLWLHARSQGFGGDIGDYCLELQASEAGKFGGDAARLNFAYHFDSVLYGRFLRQYAEGRGVKRIEGRISTVAQHPETGFITALNLEDGQTIDGDLFIDCTGFGGLLIEKTLETGWIDWGHWLPTDRAWAVQTESFGELNPYTLAAAHADGWRWRIPLQNRVGNGLVFSSQHLSEDAGRERLLSLLDAPTLVEPRLIRYRTGRRKAMWNKNCIAMGLSSGFIEPLESTSIHLFQIAVTRLIQMFPFGGVNPAVVDRYNEVNAYETERVRDFVILHYKLNQRDEPFWRERAETDIPDSLAERIALFSGSALAHQNAGDLFRVDSWVQVMLGQRVDPQSWHQFGRVMDQERLAQSFAALKSSIAQRVAAMPSHADFIRKYLA